MVFASIPFLYYFLPIVLLFYFIVPWKYKNAILLFSSLLFYFYGEARYCLLLLFSSFFHYFLGKWIEKTETSWKRKALLLIGLLVNFGILFYFKYYNFFFDTINQIFSNTFPYLEIALPLGISFFTFQTASYIIDIYRKKIKSCKNILLFTTYLSMFPQLIAGPIVRYETVYKELEKRELTLEQTALGIQRFIIGLAKKVMIADLLGSFSSTLGNLDTSILGLWLRAIADTLQLYFDFSGYSDMAIGLGLIFGFHFLENFNYPLIASSITDFWRRWHISLSSWFKDYLYIPLGGNRTSKKRHFFTIFLVWFTTGLWHGASWNFILWGLYFAFFLILEKTFLLSFLKKHFILSHFYTTVIILFSFVFFQRTDLIELINCLKGMLGLSSIPFSNIETHFYCKEYLGILLFALFFATPIFKTLYKKIDTQLQKIHFLSVVPSFLYLGLFLLCTAFIIDESFHPFLYFRF